MVLTRDGGPARTFLVTGATRGIGAAVSRRLHAAGHTVVGIARREPTESFPGTFHAADLTDPAETDRVLQEIARLHAVDGIVNNVGWALPEPVAELSLSAFWQVMNVNLQPALLAARIFVPAMTDRRWGRIVNVASTVVLGAPGRSTYAAAKSALVSFTRSWALELAPSNVTVNAVAPGNTATEGFRSGCLPGSEKESRLVRAVPMKRLGRPEEVAAAVSFLLSEEAAYVTGQTLFVDGGVSLRR